MSLEDVKRQWKLNAEKDGGIFRSDLNQCRDCGSNAIVYEFKKSIGEKSLSQFQCMFCGSAHNCIDIETMKDGLGIVWFSNDNETLKE